MRWDFIAITQFHLSHFQTLSALKMNQSLWKRLALATASLMVLLMGSMALVEHSDSLFSRNLALKNTALCGEDCGCAFPGQEGRCFAVEGSVFEYTCAVETLSLSCPLAPRCDRDSGCLIGRCVKCNGAFGGGRCLNDICLFG